MSALAKRRAVVVGMALLLAASHVVGVARYLPADLAVYYASYFSDVSLPFGFYFLLVAAEARWPWVSSWAVKAAVIIGLASAAETAQYFGVPILGSTFDPLDYLMYFAGGLLAVLADRLVFSRVFAFWNAGRPGA